MTDNGSEVSSAKKLKPYTTAGDDLNLSDLDENSSKENIKPGTKNVVLLFPNSSCSPEESVFSVDHILESIFTDLDRKTLLNCRLVSRRWLHFSSASLKKIITFQFALYYWEPGYYKFRDHFISELIPLMNNSNHFPCNSLSFVNYRRPDLFHKPDELDQKFFAAHGPFIKKLEFRGGYYLSHLKRLLLTQAPNLEELKFNWVEFRNKPADGRIYIYKRRATLELLNKTAIISSKPVFKNLKKFVVLRANSNIPDIFVQQLIECSPNLVEVFVPLEYLHFLVKPVNRLHLIRILELDIKEENIESLKAVGNSRQDNWTVHEIYFAGIWSEIETDFPSSQVAEALNTILKGCSATCLNLRFNLFTNGYHLPTMTRVNDVSFQCYDEIRATIFVEGANLGDTFPNLRSLRLSAKDCDIDLNIDSLFGKNPAPLPNVRKAFYSSDFLNAQNILERFQEIFPNAVIDTDRDTESDSDEQEGTSSDGDDSDNSNSDLY